MNPLVRARNPGQIMHDGKHTAVIEKSFFGDDRQGPRRVCGDTQARRTESDHRLSCDILQNMFALTNVLSKQMRGLGGNQFMPVAETGNLMAGCRDSAND